MPCAHIFVTIAEIEPVTLVQEECDDDHEVEDDDVAHDTVAEVEHDQVLLPSQFKSLAISANRSKAFEVSG